MFLIYQGVFRCSCWNLRRIPNVLMLLYYTAIFFLPILSSLILKVVCNYCSYVWQCKVLLLFTFNLFFINGHGCFIDSWYQSALKTLILVWLAVILQRVIKCSHSYLPSVISSLKIFTSEICSLSATFMEEYGRSFPTGDPNGLQ